MSLCGGFTSNKLIKGTFIDSIDVWGGTLLSSIIEVW